MKRLFSCVCTFVAAFILMSMTGVVTASASTGSIDTSHAKDGFVTVNYTSDSKLKVGIQYGDNKTSYKNCPSGKTAEFSLDQGDGTYTITVCENISGTTYQVVSRETVNAKSKTNMLPTLSPPQMCSLQQVMQSAKRRLKSARAQQPMQKR